MFKDIPRFMYNNREKVDGGIVKLTISAGQQILQQIKKLLVRIKMYVHTFFQVVDFLKVWKLDGSIHLSRVR